MDFTVQAIITAGGLVVAGLTFAYSLAQNRGKQFYERSVQLLDLQSRFMELGPLTGASASESAARSHEQLLADYGREARAHAALYVAAVSRLHAPGSFLGGFSSLEYAMATALITGSVASQLLEAGPVAVLIVGSLPGLTTILLTWSGARLVLRRERTLIIRGNMGEVDPLSKEGRRRFRSSLMAAGRSLLRWLNRGSAGPHPPARHPDFGVTAGVNAGNWRVSALLT